MSSRSTSPPRICGSISSQSSWLALLIVAARTPARVGRLDLVAHEGEQRRDEHRRPGPGVAQQPGGDEVDGALAPPGALHDQRSAAAVDQRLDGLELAGSEGRVGVVGQAA